MNEASSDKERLLWLLVGLDSGLEKQKYVFYTDNNLVASQNDK